MILPRNVQDKERGTSSDLNKTSDTGFKTLLHIVRRSRASTISFVTGSFCRFATSRQRKHLRGLLGFCGSHPIPLGASVEHIQWPSSLAFDEFLADPPLRPLFFNRSTTRFDSIQLSPPQSSSSAVFPDLQQMKSLKRRFLLLASFLM